MFRTRAATAPYYVGKPFLRHTCYTCGKLLRSDCIVACSIGKTGIGIGNNPVRGYRTKLAQFLRHA